MREALLNAAEPETRAVAATVIGYAANKAEVVNDLQNALQDPDEGVRDRALVSLHAIARLAVKQPRLGLSISPTWLVELLNSVVLSDRMQSAETLITLTDTANRTAIDLMKARALPALVEMARWRTLRYALPAFLLVGRVAGLSDAETQKRWSAGEREPVIARALGRSGGGKKGH